MCGSRRRVIELKGDVMYWSDEKLESLTAAELKNLLKNVGTQLAAGKVSNQVADDLCARIEARIGAMRKIAACGKRLPRTATLEHRVAAEIGRIAEELAIRYDLSPETARKLSGGTTRFVPHKLTDKSGLAKTSGAMKEGKLAIDRYISYRVRDEIVSLAFILFKGEPEENGRYYVIGTDGVFAEGQKFSEILAGKGDYGWSPAFTRRMFARPFAELEAAAASYSLLVEKLAPHL